jgi:hypothetical protein
LNDVAKAGVAKGGGGDGPDGNDRGFAGQIGNGAKHLATFALVPIEKIANGGRAEEQNSLETAGKELALSFAFRFRGKCAIGDDFSHLRAKTTERVGQLRAGQVAARQKDVFASELVGKFLRQSQTLMLHGDAAYGQTGLASHVGGDRTDGCDTQGREGIHYVDAKRSRTLHQGPNGVCAGEEEPVKRAQITKGPIERGKIIRRVKGDHGLEHGFGPASLQLTNQ